MYQALYRKWRPRIFDDVVGQDHITTTLKRQVQTGRLSHAYLFIGTRGTGKTTCAKILARAVNCEHPVDGNPCNQCASCQGIEDGSILDVVELDAASNNRVDDVRALQDEAIFTPANVKKRVYIIDEVHMLTPAAFNALLKILEEPPEHLMFILCTTELHKVLPTVVSRCQRHSFKRIEPDAISGRLAYVAAQEGITLEPDASAMLARLADGGMRDALSLLDQCAATEHIGIPEVLNAMGLAGSQRIAELLEAIDAGSAEKALVTFNALWKDGKDPAGILDELAGLMRDVLLLQTAPKNGDTLLSGLYDKKTLQYFSSKFSVTRLMDGMSEIRAADLSGSNPRRTAELCLVRLCMPETGDTLAGLKARIAKLESMLQGGITLPVYKVPSNIPEAPAPKPAAAAPKPAISSVPTPASAPESEPAPAAEPAPTAISEPEPPTETAPEPAATPEPVISSEPEPATIQEQEQEPAAMAEPEPSIEPMVSSLEEEAPWYTDDDAPPEDQSFVPPFPEEAPTKPPAAPEPPAVPKAPEPEADEQLQEKSSEPEDDFWMSLLWNLNGKLDLGAYAALSVPSQANGLLRGDVLTVYLGNPFMHSMINNPTTSAAIQAEASALAGFHVDLIFTDEPLSELSDQPNMSKLEELKKFPNFRME